MLEQLEDEEREELMLELGIDELSLEKENGQDFGKGR
jgi:hypothetical protein